MAWSITGVSAVIARMNRLDDQVQKAGLVGMRRGMLLGQGIVRGHASGRPGPRVITGDFRRSIIGDVAASGSGSVQGQIGSSAPQAARLEYGFVGADSLGRVYNQPPFPYLQPSVPEVTDAVVAEISAALSAVL